jgi:hypothetical protein
MLFKKNLDAKETYRVVFFLKYMFLKHTFTITNTAN